MERGFARPGADLGADSGADFIFERRGIVGRLHVGSNQEKECGVTRPNENYEHV